MEVRVKVFRTVGAVTACPGNQGPALASKIWTLGILISGCPLQVEEWDSVHQASTVPPHNPVQRPSV